jgi:transcriptional regulator with XRE-family HTH domain
LSKYALSERSGLAQQTIGYIERGLRSPSFETVWKLADGLGVDLSKFMTAARREHPKNQ